jgi:hypothetical protein
MTGPRVLHPPVPIDEDPASDWLPTLFSPVLKSDAGTTESDSLAGRNPEATPSATRMGYEIARAVHGRPPPPPRPRESAPTRTVPVKGSRTTKARAKKAPEKSSQEKTSFDLKSSDIAKKIRDGLAKVGSKKGFDAAITPTVDPDSVLDLLASSPSFLKDAEIAQRKNPNLEFDMHAEYGRGTFTKRVRGKTTIVLYVDEITEVVRRVAHEVRHASRQAPTPAVPEGTGDIAAVEMKGVTEEIDTRGREAKVMQELNLPRDPGSTDAAQVRSDFWSGRPQMTYQEMFIVEAMKNENRVASLTDEKAEELARMFMPPEAPSGKTVGKFTINVGRQRRNIGLPLPPEPPAYSVAKEWRNNFAGKFFPSKELSRIQDAPKEAVEFLGRFFAYPSNDELVEMIHEMWLKRQIVETEIAHGSLFTSFLRGVPPRSRAKAVLFIEWVMIGEALGMDWDKAEKADDEKRQRHLDFLVARLRSRLFGIERPLLPRPEIEAPPPPKDQKDM